MFFLHRCVSKYICIYICKHVFMYTYNYACTGYVCKWINIGLNVHSLVVHVHQGIRINMFVPFYPFFFANEYISKFNKAMGSKCKHRRRVIMFFFWTTFLMLYFLYKINFASAGNLETIRSFSPFSSLVDIDVLICLFCYYYLLSLQTVILYIFLVF